MSSLLFPTRQKKAAIFRPWFKCCVTGVLFLLTVASICLSAENKPTDLSSRIDSVTVFYGNAAIVRKVEKTLEPGTHTLQISHLPVKLLNSSVRVSAKGDADAEILNVKVEKKYLSEALLEKNRQMEREQRRLTEKQEAIKDQLDALEQKKETLTNLMKETAAAITGGKDQPLPQLQTWQSSLDFLENQLVSIATKKRGLDKEGMKIREELALLDGSMSQSRQEGEKAEKNLVVTVNAKTRGTLALTAHYLVPDAKWAPSYDCRISQDATKTALTCSANIVQQTGEDWKQVKITLSTARPLVVKQVPRLTPIIMAEPADYSGQIIGEVLDPDGVQLPGITVILKDENLSQRTTATNSTGMFRFLNLTPGVYQLIYMLEGMHTLEQKDIRVANGKTTRPRVTMTLKVQQEMVLVSAQAPMVDRQNVSATTTYSADRPDGIATGGGQASSDYHSDGGKSKGKQSVTIEGEGVKLKIPMEHFTTAEPSLALDFSPRYRETVLSNNTPQKTTLAIRHFDVKMDYVAVPRRSVNAFLKATVRNVSDEPLLPGPVSVFYNGTFVNTASIDFINPGDTFAVAVGEDKSVTATREPIKEISNAKGFLKKKTKIHLGYKIKVKNYRNKTIDVFLTDQIPISKDEKIKILPTLIQPEAQKEEESKDDGILNWTLTLKPGETKEIHVEYDVIHPEGMEVEEQL